MRTTYTLLMLHKHQFLLTDVHLAVAGFRQRHPYEQFETAPTYPKGIPAFYDYLVRSLKYPSEAKKNNVEGRVFVEFTIQKDGSIANVKAIRGIGSGCDEEAVRIVRGSPKWIPGKQRGQPVNQKMVLPINFSLK